MQKLQGFVEQGNTTLSIAGAAGTITRKVQGSFPSATVTVYINNPPSIAISSISRTSNVVTVTIPANSGFIAGESVTIAGVTDASFNGTFTIVTSGTTTFTYAQTAANASSSGGTASSTLRLATIYSDNGSTAKANPFVAGSDSTWFLYAPNGRYDIKFSGAGISAPFTIGDFLLYDPSLFYVDPTSSPYNAIGNGSADDSAGLQAALTAASNAGGGVVLLPANKNFKFATGLTFGIGVSMKGIGKATSKLTYSGSGIAIAINASGSDSWNVLEDFQLTTTTTSPAVGPGTHGIQLKNIGHVTLRGIRVRGFSTAGVHLNAAVGEVCLNIDIDNCTIDENQDGILQSGGNSLVNAINIINSDVRANLGWNIYVPQSVFAWRIAGCNLEGAGSGGAYLNFPYGCDIDTCYFEQTNTNPCISLSFAAGGTDGAKGVFIHDCEFQGNAAGGSAIICGTSSFVYASVIAANTFTGVWTNAIGAVAGKGCIIGPNDVAAGITHVASIVAGSTGVWINDVAKATTNSPMGIGTTSPVASALMELVSTTQGFLVPRMTGAQQNAIGSPASALMIWSSTTNQFEWYDGTRWGATFTNLAARLATPSTSLIRLQVDRTTLNDQWGVDFADASRLKAGIQAKNDNTGNNRGTIILLVGDGTGNIVSGFSVDSNLDVKIFKALVALGGGAAPTLGTIGGAGPATAAQNSWLRFLDSTGTAFWVPAWK